MSYTDYIRQTPEGYIRVVSSADYDSIVSYTPLPDITVFVDAVVNLPNTVQATFKSGKVETMIIKWERVNVDTSIAGTQKIYGDIGNGAAAVLQNVIVEENLTDLDILRQIRDANPTSQLPTLWLDNEDPYTQWDGVQWVTIGNSRYVDAINFTHTNIVNDNAGIVDFSKLKQLKKLAKLELQAGGNRSNVLIDIDVSDLTNLQEITWQFRNLRYLNIAGCNLLTVLNVGGNLITSIPTLTSKGNIVVYNFTYNKMPVTETNRITALGFSSTYILPQNP